MMICADILGPWWDVEVTETDPETGETVTRREQRRLPQFLYDVGEMDWRDIRGQASEIIPPSPGVGLWRVWCTEEQAARLCECDAYTVVRRAEVATSSNDPIRWPRAVVGERDNSERTAFPSLPPIGALLDQGAIYQHGDRCVVVRQAHTRTEHDPADVPALFLLYREDAADELAWVAGEQVYVGTRRSYAGVLYTCLQAHVTEPGWTPDKTPALWSVVQTEPTTDEWQAGVAYNIGDVVTYESITYECRQAHSAQVGWEPPKVLALWLPVEG
jgi:hypothetical protein